METAGQVSENDGTDQKLPDQQLKKGVTDYEQDCIYFPGTGCTVLWNGPGFLREYKDWKSDL